jgi:N-acyl-D-amino-acid deacylase
MTMRLSALMAVVACSMAIPSGAPSAHGGEVPVSGEGRPELAAFDDLMTSFVRKHEVPGATLAVARRGKIVYARGFGHADREAGEPVRPESLFRIASLSKPITAAAILTLAGRGKLDVEARVFDLLHLEGRIPGGATLDPRWRSVTVLQLLRHTGGWDRARSFDPMFRAVDFARQAGTQPPANPPEIIRAMLGVPLDFDPGTRYAYSNFGYCLLGRVIEAASGCGYEAFVREEVLAPLGIRAMRLGRTHLADRAPGEVRYYEARHPTGSSVFAADLGESVPTTYGTWNQEALDAHGGWIASAADLVRFGSALDDGADPRLLGPRMAELLIARPEGAAGHTPAGTPKPSYYACGWNVLIPDAGGVTTWHTGSLPGTSTLLVRRHDGLCWAVLFNTRSGSSRTDLAVLIDPLLHRVADGVKSWPDTEPAPPRPDGEGR